MKNNFWSFVILTIFLMGISACSSKGGGNGNASSMGEDGEGADAGGEDDSEFFFNSPIKIGAPIVWSESEHIDLIITGAGDVLTEKKNESESGRITLEADLMF